MPPEGTTLYFSGQKEALNTQINQLKDKIIKAKVTAPQNGLIRDLTVKEGAFAGQGQLLLKVFRGEGYLLECYVLASDALSINVGDEVEIIQDTQEGTKSFVGQVANLEPYAVERISPLGLKENRVKVTINLNNNTSLIIGSKVDVKFTTLKEPNKILVPKNAIFPYKNGHAVWVVREGKADIQPITKGPENERCVVIETGLAEGDKVLLNHELKGLKVGKRINAL